MFDDLVKPVVSRAVGVGSTTLGDPRIICDFDRMGGDLIDSCTNEAMDCQLPATNGKRVEVK